MLNQSSIQLYIHLQLSSSFRPEVGTRPILIKLHNLIVDGVPIGERMSLTSRMAVVIFRVGLTLGFSNSA